MNQSFARGRRILLLQGPIGPYFGRLARQLRDAGAHAVLKVNFNGGDCFFHPDGVAYTGAPDAITAFVRQLVIDERIDLVMLTGDCRPVHAGIAPLCAQLEVELRVFEEGYFRPAYITCELGGVNGYSAIPNRPGFYLGHDEPEPAPEAMPSRRTYWAMVAWSILYYLACAIAHPAFHRYRHHRPLNVVGEGLRWLRGAGRKWHHRFRERSYMSTLTGHLSGRFFLVPLQVHNDAQVQVHSPYSDVASFMHEVARSFSHNAPCEVMLVFKHHPMDRAYRDYTALVQELMETYALAGRMLYMHDQHLPTVLDHARGAVVINSTVGLASLHQGVPTKVMGKAFYDFEGMTYQGDLDRFWNEAREHVPRRDLYLAFRRWVIRNTQINDSFYWPIRSRAAIDNETHRAQQEPLTRKPSRAAESIEG